MPSLVIFLYIVLALLCNITSITFVDIVISHKRANAIQGKIWHSDSCVSILNLFRQIISAATSSALSYVCYIRRNLVVNTLYLKQMKSFHGGQPIGLWAIIVGCIPPVCTGLCTVLRLCMPLKVTYQYKNTNCHPLLWQFATVLLLLLERDISFKTCFIIKGVCHVGIKNVFVFVAILFQTISNLQAHIRCL